jgi:arginase
MSRVALIQVPYHLGHERLGMGAGPDALVDAGLAGTLADAGHDVEVVRVARTGEAANEIAASFEVLRAVAAEAGAAVRRGAFPLALAGNCMTSIALVAAVARDVGALWLDAHADFNTAESTTSGFADGMGLSILTGTGWDALRATIPGYRAVPEERVVLAGIRDVDPAEEERLAASAVAVVRPRRLDELERALDALREHVAEIYLHVDLDVLDPSEGRANPYAADAGLTAAELERAVDAAAARFQVLAAAVTAYDPACDPESLVPAVAKRVVPRVVAAAARAEGAPA